MGTHYAYDMSLGNGRMSWRAQQLFPLMPMYDTDGSLTAMLLPSVSRQFEFLYKPNQHDGIFIPNTLMCLNFCDKRCSWDADHKWAIW